MTSSYQIHPTIGIARLGNSPDEFYLSPETVGGLPLCCDASGNAISDSGQVQYVDQFKDSVGRIKRQAARFRVFEQTDNGSRQIAIGEDDIDKIVWTVHIANKKPIWYSFSELQGDLEFGESNSYKNQHIAVNNSDVTSADRQALIIDPGPRSISSPGDLVEFSRYNIPTDYPHGSFPPAGSGGTEINSLGELRMDDSGNLIALGGFGNVTGSGDITSFIGANGYWDDVSDGFVLATVHLKNGKTIDASPAWLLVGSPKYAPELVNITTLWDTAYDTAIRFLDCDSNIFKACADTKRSFPDHQGYTPLNGYNPDYVANFETQILPIIERMQSYRWVADIPYLNDFANPPFDLTDASAANLKNRQQYFEFFRVPVLAGDYEWINKIENGPNQLFSQAGIPLMPLNSGDNSVTNSGPIYKFETLSATQYFFLHQWAIGKFTANKNSDSASPAAQLDEASIGNCVGAPFSPGIETTWIMRNAPIYHSLATLKLAHFDGSNTSVGNYYQKSGLSTTADEAEGQGCEPGDITKRMAIPWQSDFQECTVQTPNITNPTINQFADGTGVEIPPAYYVYWWPPQSPMHVMTGSLTPNDQVLDAVVSNIAGQPIIPAGQRVPYQRGIESPQDMIDSWSRLGFIVNQGVEGYPYFVETERNNQALVQIAMNKKASES